MKVLGKKIKFIGRCVGVTYKSLVVIAINLLDALSLAMTPVTG